MIPTEIPEPSQALIHDIRRVIPDCHFDRMTRVLYSTDASIYQMMPVGVVMPRDTDDVSAALEIAATHGMPILPRGGGSSLAGQAVGHALILDLSYHMHRVLEVDPERRFVRTQPGITLGLLNRRLKKHGLMYGPDPASADRATIGGVLGNNSTGAHSIDYGMTDEHVISVKTVMADGHQTTFGAFPKEGWARRARRRGLEGEIYRELPRILAENEAEIGRRYPRTFRHVAGYNLQRLVGAEPPNLARLIVGSEGTLAVMTEMTLNLVPIPKFKRLAMVHFSELREAMEAVPHILECGASAIEVLDKMLLDLTRDKIEYRRLLTFVRGDPEIVLLVEFAGDSQAEIDAGAQKLGSVLKAGGHAGPVVHISDPAEQAKVWYVRKVGLGILMSIRGDAKPIPFIEDAAVPVEHLAEYVTQIFDFAYQVGLDRVAMYGHASAGCLHVRPVVDLKSSQGVHQMRQIAEKSVDLVVALGGTTSGEHGEGIARGEFSERLFGPRLMTAFREVKKLFDPHNFLNPGKIVDVPRMDDESLLRFGDGYRTPQEPQGSALSFETDGGFAGAVEMCNGAGVCRKLEEGVMCPSFQATRDETHSTRGRANALRAAMMGLLGPDAMTSDELYRVLDLCLSCQACKSECPSAVDMAKIKAEFLHNFHKAHGTPLRARAFASIGTLNRMAQPIAPLFNSLMRGPGAWVMTLLGVHPDRPMPELASTSFSAWYRRHRASPSSSPALNSRQVVLFHDTFMEHNHPNVGRAAVKVLEAAGFEPILLEDKRCCGRPAVSKGLLGQAKDLARHNTALLAPYARRGISILGCEPSCMAMLVGEYLDLVPGEEAREVASMSMMIDQFLAQQVAEGELELHLDDTPRQVLFHGHCHQKANFGTQSTLEVLRLIPNCTVEEIDSGCCGMAGSFGYEREHYALSIQLAEMSLAPAVRAAPEEAIISATGTSCREQIGHTTGRRAVHPIEVLAGALLDG
jgi:FAD/FMN-containing dehydrogenase/Fe-S oxidoreductase